MIVGIAGGSGCGKTTFVHALMEALHGQPVSLLSQDAYYRDLSHMDPAALRDHNFDHPDALDFDLLVSHVAALRAGQAVEEPVYDYQTCTRQQETQTIQPFPVLLVEGILILTHAGLRDLLDLKLYMHLPADQRLVQIVERDIAERGRNASDVLSRYLKTVRPMHERYVEPSREYADLIIPHGGKNRVAVSLIGEYIRRQIKSSKSGV